MQCPACDGTGLVDTTVLCGVCDGDGAFVAIDDTGTPLLVVCDNCSATGVVATTQDCPACSGTGKAKAQA